MAPNLDQSPAELDNFLSWWSSQIPGFENQNLSEKSDALFSEIDVHMDETLRDLNLYVCNWRTLNFDAKFTFIFKGKLTDYLGI